MTDVSANKKLLRWMRACALIFALTRSTTAKAQQEHRAAVGRSDALRLGAAADQARKVSPSLRGVPVSVLTPGSLLSDNLAAERALDAPGSSSKWIVIGLGVVVVAFGIWLLLVSSID